MLSESQSLRSTSFGPYQIRVAVFLAQVDLLAVESLCITGHGCLSHMLSMYDPKVNAATRYCTNEELVDMMRIAKKTWYIAI